jgi:hypothetical protein
MQCGFAVEYLPDCLAATIRAICISHRAGCKYLASDLTSELVAILGDTRVFDLETTAACPLLNE